MNDTFQTRRSRLLNHGYWYETVEPGSSHRDKSDRRIASLLLTKNSVFFAIGFDKKGLASEVEGAISRVDLCACGEIKGTGPDVEGKGRSVSEEDVALAVEIIYREAPCVTHIAASSFGPFEAIGRHLRPAHSADENHPYGKFPENLTNYPEWSTKNLYRIISSFMRLEEKKLLTERRGAHPEKRPSSAKLLIGLDVNFAALGEHYWFLDKLFSRDEHAQDALYTYLKAKDGSLKNKSFRLKADEWRNVWEKYDRACRETTVYIKVSQSVNVGFTSDGWIGRGRQHSQMSAYRPRKTLIPGFTDDYAGYCEAHGDCIEGLISQPALAHRLQTELKRPVSVDSLFCDVNLNDHIWHFSAAYLAELSMTCAALLAPVRIAMGGSVIKGEQREDGSCWNAFMDLTRAHFRAKLLPGNLSRPIPAYIDLEGLQSFITYRSCQIPALFGGLLVARWDRTNLKPLTSQVVLQGDLKH